MRETIKGNEVEVTNEREKKSTIHAERGEEREWEESLENVRGMRQRLRRNHVFHDDKEEVFNI